MIYTIRAKNDLFNAGQCFTKGKCYEVETSRVLTTNASLMETHTYNDQREMHLIGSWWREFDIEKTYIATKENETEKFKAFSYAEARQMVNEKFDSPEQWEIEEQNY